MLVFHSEKRLLWDCYPLLTMIPGATIVGMPCKISVGFTAGFWLKPPLFNTKESLIKKHTHVQDEDITIVNGDYVMVYKPTNITGGPHPLFYNL